VVVHPAPARLAAHQPAEQGLARPPLGRRPRPAVDRQLPGDAVEHVGIDNAVVLAVEDLVAVPHPADVDGVGQQRVDRGLVHRLGLRERQSLTNVSHHVGT